MKFDEFEVDPESGELRRNGTRVKLQDLPFRTLLALLRRPGSVVTRDELRAELWGAETFVDAEAGLNTAVAKIREALGDNAETPRFIETLPKRGYRFIGTLRDSAAASAPMAPRQPRRLLSLTTLVLIPGLTALAVLLWLARAEPISIAVVRFHNETGQIELDRLAGALTDAVVVSLADNTRYAIIGNSPLLRTERIFQDVQKIGGALGADYVVLGQLQSGDAGLVARAHFIRVSDQKHLWAGKVDLAGVPDPERVLTAAVADGVARGLNR
jgi:DNA-binding winged helix-turn-helix (wHTH) protein/TolB-like protein